MKYFDIFKDFFLVFSDFKESGYRPSEAIIVNVIILLGSAAILFGFDLGITEVEAGVMATGVMSVIGIILRFRSSGGESKLKVVRKVAKKEGKTILEEYDE